MRLLLETTRHPERQWSRWHNSSGQSIYGALNKQMNKIVCLPLNYRNTRYAPASHSTKPSLNSHWHAQWADDDYTVASSTSKAKSKPSSRSHGSSSKSKSRTAKTSSGKGKAPVQEDIPFPLEVLAVLDLDFEDSQNFEWERESACSGGYPWRWWASLRWSIYSIQSS